MPISYVRGMLDGMTQRSITSLGFISRRPLRWTAVSRIASPRVLQDTPIWARCLPTRLASMDVDNRFERVRAAIEQLGPADHACTLYDRRDEAVAIAVSYIRAGLHRDEYCVCVVDDGGVSILAALASE